MRSASHILLFCLMSICAGFSTAAERTESFPQTGQWAEWRIELRIPAPASRSSDKNTLQSDELQIYHLRLIVPSFHNEEAEISGMLHFNGKEIPLKKDYFGIYKTITSGRAAIPPSAKSSSKNMSVSGQDITVTEFIWKKDNIIITRQECEKVPFYLVKFENLELTITLTGFGNTAKDAPAFPINSSNANTPNK